jgi:hypothetical protein
MQEEEERDVEHVIMHGLSVREEAYAMRYVWCALQFPSLAQNQYSLRIRPRPLLLQHSLYRHHHLLYRPGGLGQSHQPSFRPAVCPQSLLLPLPSPRGMCPLPTARAPCPRMPECSGVCTLGTRLGLGRPALPPQLSVDSQ